jgi:quercetin dioxygenase-like cupin family protein
MSFATSTEFEEALLVRAGAAERLGGDPGGTITLLADAVATGGRLNVHRSTFLDAGDDAPPHAHTRSSELFYVLAGSLQVLLGERLTTLDQGDLLVVPPGTTHAFGAAFGATADVLFVFVPGVPRFDYYRLLDRTHRGEAGLDEILASQDRFGNHYVESPIWRAARAGG